MTEFKESTLDDVLNSYYSGIVFKKVDFIEGRALYAAKLESMTIDGSGKFLFAFVPFCYSSEDKSFLKNLVWENFQTRAIKGSKYRLQSQAHKRAKIEYDPVFIVSERTNYSSKYTSEVCVVPVNGEASNCFDLEIINNPDKKTKFQYHNKLSLTTALETFNCCITRVQSRKDFTVITQQTPVM